MRMLTSERLHFRQRKKCGGPAATEGDGSLEYPHRIAVARQFVKLLALVGQGLGCLQGEVSVGREVLGRPIEVAGTFFAVCCRRGGAPVEVAAEVARQGLVGNLAQQRVSRLIRAVRSVTEHAGVDERAQHCWRLWRAELSNPLGGCGFAEDGDVLQAEFLAGLERVEPGCEHRLERRRDCLVGRQPVAAVGLDEQPARLCHRHELAEVERVAACSLGEKLSRFARQRHLSDELRREQDRISARQWAEADRGGIREARDPVSWLRTPG